MKYTITYHGQLTELMQKREEPLETHFTTAKQLTSFLQQRNPKLKEINFQLAQDNTIIQGNDELTENNIDIFPPFSGG